MWEIRSIPGVSDKLEEENDNITELYEDISVESFGEGNIGIAVPIELFDRIVEIFELPTPKGVRFVIHRELLT